MDLNDLEICPHGILSKTKYLVLIITLKNHKEFIRIYVELLQDNKFSFLYSHIPISMVVISGRALLCDDVSTLCPRPPACVRPVAEVPFRRELGQQAVSVWICISKRAVRLI